MKKIIPFLLLFVFGCGDEDLQLTESFFKIYDDTNADLSYNPIDVEETIDGFIVLTGTEVSNTDFQGIQLLKMDDEGNYLFDVEISDYVVPIGELHLIDSTSYFFAMNPTSLQAVLIGVNPQLEVTVEAPIGGINYPLSSAMTSSNELLLQSYDLNNLTTEISLISTDGSFVNGASYSIGPGDDVEEEIINHYLGAGEQPLPFFCGELTSGNYYFNGFYNFSFSLVFTDFSATPNGVVQGQSSDAGIRAALPLSGSDFAVAGYQFSDNFQLSSTTLSTTSTTSSVDLYPGNMAELKSYTPSKILSYSTAEGDFTVFAAETEGRQIILHFYNATSGEVQGIHYLGFLNPFAFSSIKVGSDNSLLVLGTTFVAGRFERVALTKISESEVSEIIK